MPEDPKKHDQFEKDADAIDGGGATTDRGNRDMGHPGPAPEEADKERERGEHHKAGETKKG
jgi:hypothetical protein